MLKVLRTIIPPGENEERTKTRWKDACKRDMKSSGLRVGADWATRSRKLISHTGNRGLRVGADWATRSRKLISHRGDRGLRVGADWATVG